MFLKSTICKLEATETRNSYLSMQKKFVKNALSNLTSELQQSDGNFEKAKLQVTKGSKCQSQFATEFGATGVPDTPKDFCRLSLNYRSPKGKKSQGEVGNYPHIYVEGEHEEVKDEPLQLKSYFRDMSGKEFVVEVV